MPRQRLTRDESREQTRDRLLAAAAALFAERGVNGASVEQIAERAGYSRGAFYGNFTDKHALIVALLEERTTHEIEEVGALRLEAGSFEALLEPLRAWNRERARHLDDWLALRLELWLYALRHPEMRSLLANREQLARAAITAGITHELAERGVRPPADAAFLGLIVHALEDGLFIQRLLDPDIADEVVVDAVALLMRSWIALGERGAEASDPAV